MGSGRIYFWGEIWSILTHVCTCTIERLGPDWVRMRLCSRANAMQIHNRIWDRERCLEDMEYTKLNVQVPFPFHSYIFHIPHQFIYLFVFVSGKRMKMAMAGMLFQWLIMCPLWEVPPLTGPIGSSSMSIFFSQILSETHVVIQRDY